MTEIEELREIGWALADKVKTLEKRVAGLEAAWAQKLARSRPPLTASTQSYDDHR